MKIRFHKGFTLIELVLATSLFSMVAVLVYSVFWGGMKLGHRSEKSNTMYHEGRWFFDIISKELENMVAYDFSKSFTENYSFQGQKDRISFILPQEDGLKVVQYFLESPEKIHIHEVLVNNVMHKNTEIQFNQTLNKRFYYLIRKEMGLVDFLQDDESLGQTEIVASSVKENGLRFSYGKWKTLGMEKASSWDEDGLPMEITIEVDFLDGKENEEFMTFKRDVFVPVGNKRESLYETGA